MLTHIKNVHEKEPETPKKITGGKCKFCNEVNFFIPLMPEFWSYIQHFELFFKYIFHSLTTCSTTFSLKNYFKLSCFNVYFFVQQEFTLMKHLKKHISEVHKDYKPFICKLCPAKFYQGGHLRRKPNLFYHFLFSKTD